MAVAIVGAVFAGVAGVGFALAPDSGVHPLTAEAVCPVAGCASVMCHGYDAVPEPDGHSEMRCPEAGCASVECHGMDTLTGRYHQASDMSLNLWILMPVTLVLGLWLAVHGLSKGEQRGECLESLSYHVACLLSGDRKSGDDGDALARISRRGRLCAYGCSCCDER